jgi:hypothetical protein
MKPGSSSMTQDSNPESLGSEGFSGRGALGTGESQHDPFSGQQSLKGGDWFGSQASQASSQFKSLLDPQGSLSGRKSGQLRSLRESQNENHDPAGSVNKGAASFLRETPAMDSVSPLNGGGVRDMVSVGSSIDPVNEYKDPTRQALNPVISPTSQPAGLRNPLGFDSMQSTMASPLNSSRSQLSGVVSDTLSKPAIAGTESVVGEPRKPSKLESTPIRFSRPRGSF